MIPPTAAGEVLEIPLVIVGQGLKHEIVPVHPVLVTLPSDVNTNVKHPEAFVGVAVTVPGPTAPVYVPNVGDAVFGPLYTYRKSKLFSKAKAVKLTITLPPGVEGQMV
jgi:hypothetical protein